MQVMTSCLQQLRHSQHHPCCFVTYHEANHTRFAIYMLRYQRHPCRFVARKKANHIRVAVYDDGKFNTNKHHQN